MPACDSRLLRVLGVAQVEDRVHALKGVHRLQDRIRAYVKAVELEPLEIADPHGHLGELEGVRVDLDPVELPGADLGQEARQLLLYRPDDDLLSRSFSFWSVM